MSTSLNKIIVSKQILGFFAPLTFDDEVLDDHDELDPGDGERALHRVVDLLRLVVVQIGEHGLGQAVALLGRAGTTGGVNGEPRYEA